jgi:hypothetical protein
MGTNGEREKKGAEMAGWQREMRGDFCVEKGKGESAAEGRREACVQRESFG